MILDPEITPADDYICEGMSGATSKSISGTGPWKFQYYIPGIWIATRPLIPKFKDIKLQHPSIFDIYHLKGIVLSQWSHRILQGIIVKVTSRMEVIA